MSVGLTRVGSACDRAAAPVSWRGSRLVEVIARYSRPEMSRIWSEEGKLARWLEVELAALDGWAEVGAVPAADVAAIRAGARDADAERVAEIELTTDHDLAAFVDAVAEQLGPEGRWVHYGLTSSDVVDTALALQIRDAGELLLAGIDRALAAVVAARRGAPAHRLHRPLARHPRRADDVRLEARGLGVRARPRAANGSSARSRRAASASSRARSGRTPRSTPRSSASPASGSGSSRTPCRRR